MDRDDMVEVWVTSGKRYCGRIVDAEGFHACVNGRVASDCWWSVPPAADIRPTASFRCRPAGAHSVPDREVIRPQSLAFSSLRSGRLDSNR